MFTGIAAGISSVVKVQKRDRVLELVLLRPSYLKNIKKGDSIAVDGVCLTLEKVHKKQITFALGLDTLKTTGWNSKSLLHKKVNLEPALKMNSSVGGHWVTGHVDSMAVVKKVHFYGENQFLTLALPLLFKKFIWPKSFLTVNGVSLTIQEAPKKSLVRLGIVPETLKRTNLSDLKAGMKVTFEICYLARALYYFLKESGR